MARAEPPTAPKPLVLGQDKRPQFAYPHRIADAAAVQAIANGTATPDQQIRGMRWIIEKGCMTYDETFHPESDRASNFMQGRRFVGLKLVLMINASINALKRREDPHATLSETGA
jgi:hypothetical protein